MLEIVTLDGRCSSKVQQRKVFKKIGRQGLFYVYIEGIRKPKTISTSSNLDAYTWKDQIGRFKVQRIL